MGQGKSVQCLWYSSKRRILDVFLTWRVDLDAAYWGHVLSLVQCCLFWGQWAPLFQEAGLQSDQPCLTWLCSHCSVGMMKKWWCWAVHNYPGLLQAVLCACSCIFSAYLLSCSSALLKARVTAVWMQTSSCIPIEKIRRAVCSCASVLLFPVLSRDANEW